MDNVCLAQEIAQEILKGYRRKNISSQMAIKIDIKAYDSVSWVFLKRFMKQLGVPQKFLKWIMMCFTLPWNTINMNGTLNDLFKGSKRVRQSDPLSSYLFVIYMEYLPRMCLNKYCEKVLKYHRRCKMLKISHLMFFDDLLLFSTAFMESATRIR